MLPQKEFVSVCDKYEKGIGTVLRNAWLHVEVLQTTDIAALINHIFEVLLAANEMMDIVDGLCKQGDIHQRQEVLVFYYMYGVVKHLDDLGEYRVLPLIRERNIFMLSVQTLCMIGKYLLRAHKLKAAEALSLLAESEDFVTYRPEYIQTQQDVDILLEFKETVLADLITDFENRKLVRPLIDAIDKAKRTMKFK